MTSITLDPDVKLLRYCSTERYNIEKNKLGHWFWAEYKKSECSGNIRNIFNSYGFEIIIKKKINLLLLCDNDKIESKYKYANVSKNNPYRKKQVEMKILNDNYYDGFLSVNENYGYFEIFLKYPNDVAYIYKYYNPNKILEQIGLYEYHLFNYDTKLLSLLLDYKEKILNLIDYSIYVQFPIIDFDKKIIYSA
jgi:hypothetical protein